MTCKYDYSISTLHVHIVISSVMYNNMDTHCFDYVGIGPSPGAGQIDPKAIARQAIMK